MPEQNNSTQNRLSAKNKLVGKLGTGYVGSSLNYNNLRNKPSIEDVELIGNKTFEELGLAEIDNLEIDKLFKQYFDI